MFHDPPVTGTFGPTLGHQKGIATNLTTTIDNTIQVAGPSIGRGARR